MKGVVRWVTGKTAGVEGEHGLCRCGIRGRNLLSGSFTLVVGDEVEYQPTQDDEGMLVSCEKRENVVHRWDELQRSRQLIAANLTDVYCMVAARSPPYDLEFLTSVLIAADIQGLRAQVICTKIDLTVPDSLRTYLDYLQSMGYVCHYVNNLTKEGISCIEAEMQSGKSLLCGQSGVGKSTLTNILIPGVERKTQETSRKGGRGRHTTNCAMLYPYGQGHLIDAPGVRYFGLYGYSLIDIRASFSDFAEYAVDCRFHGCLHLHEPRCAVLAAEQAGLFPSGRYAVYRRIIEAWQAIDASLRTRGLFPDKKT